MAITVKSTNSNDELIVNSSGAALVQLVNTDGTNDTGYLDFGSSGNLGANSGSTFTLENTGGYSSICFQLTIPTGGTVSFQGSADGATWNNLTLRQVGDDGYVRETTQTGAYIGSISCLRSIRVLVTVTGSSTGTVSGRASREVNTLEGIENAPPNDFELNLAEGKIAYHSIVNKAGFNPDIDTATVPEDIWEAGGVYTGFPATAGETITVVSTNPNDTAAGSGARTIRITGLDANYNIQSETFTLNGVTPVVGTLVFTRVHTATILTSGSSNTAFNAGIITAFHTTTTANIFISIRAGSNQSNNSAYTIPAGYTGYVRNIHSSVNSASAAASGVDISIWLQPALKTSAPRLRRPNTGFYAENFFDAIYGGLVFTEKTDLILRCTACSQNNTGVNAGYDLILVKN